MCKLRGLVVLVVLCVGPLQQASCVIWGRDGDDQGQVLPQELDYERDRSEMSQVPHNMKRFLRAATPHGIGHTEPIGNDSHSFALVHWTGYPSQYLFVLTRKRGRDSRSTESWLWRSTDYGHTFTNDTRKWGINTVIEWYYIAPLSQYLIFSDRIHSLLWVTRNEGDTYSNHLLPFTPITFRFQSRLAVGSNDFTLSEYVLGYDSDSSLWVSTNLGSRWTMLSANVTRYYWRVMNSTIEHNSTVYYEKFINATHSQLYYSQFPYEDSNLFSHLPPFLRNTFVLSNEYMFVQMGSVSGGGDQYASPLFVSRYRAPFRQARFPLQTQEKHYAVVDSTEGQVFIAVYHDINNTNLYLSEEEGLEYSLSLFQIISPSEDEWVGQYPQFDVHVVEGLAGTYIANTRDPSRAFGSTLISYDKGGNWVKLTPPLLDKGGSGVVCQPPTCSLHLHIKSDTITGYQSILTQDSAIGLIMGQGNLGSSLTNNIAQLRLYFSRDGGISWVEVNEGFWQFQFAGQGSIVVAIQMYQAVSSVLWSCDEGTNWGTVEFLEDFSSGTFRSVGMLTEQGEKALHVTVFGIETPFMEWIVVDLNFTSVLPNQCTQEDFYNWIPTDERPGSPCLLGEVDVYQRRNSSDCCYVDPRFNRIINKSSCFCSREDFECDFGFKRIQLNSPCTPMTGFQWPPLQPSNCTEGATYTISSGYRKVAGDQCVPGDELSYFPLQRPCIADPPELLSFELNSLHAFPNTIYTFTLLQLGGQEGIYTWDFNDSTVVTVRGYDLGHAQTHTFTSLGMYNVSVSVSNSGGRASITQQVLVYDILAGVSIIPPSQLTSSQLPTSLEVVFKSSINTTFHTAFTGGLRYTWVFGDHSPDFVSNSSTTATHVYRNNGSITLTLTVKVIESTTQVSRNLSFTVFEASDSSSVKIIGSDFVNNTYVKVGLPVTLSVVSKQGSDHIIPPGTHFTWHIIPPQEPSCNANPVQSASNVSSGYTYNFPCWGDYDISVVGNHSAGSFAPQTHITAESVVISLAITTSIAPVMRSGIYLSLSLTSMTAPPDSSYQGRLAISRLFPNNSMISLTRIPQSNGVDVISVQLVREGSTAPPQQNLTLVASNDVSRANASLIVTLAVLGEYGELRFLFPTFLLPPNIYNTSEWMDDLTTALLSMLEARYHLPASSLEVERKGFISVPLELEESQLKKRSVVDDTDLYVEINIFPNSVQTSDINNILNVTHTIVTDGIHGNLPAITVRGVAYNATVQMRDGGIIIDPVPAPSNTVLYVGVGAGLGVGLGIFIIVAIALAMALYFYRRRYKRLNVRYSRLRQTPVRFTFNQGGEMVEEEDYEQDGEDGEEEAVDS